MIDPVTKIEMLDADTMTDWKHSLDEIFTIDGEELMPVHEHEQQAMDQLVKNIEKMNKFKNELKKFRKHLTSGEFGES